MKHEMASSPSRGFGETGVNTMERLDPRASKRVSGPSWAKVRPQFERINEALLGVSPETQGMLTTVYVKYAPDPHQQPFAVLWVRKSTELILGLSLPEAFESPLLGESPVGCKYAGLTWYLTVLPEDDVPDEIDDWAKLAHAHAQG